VSRLTVNVDGGSRGNPGPAGIGIVVRDGSGEVVAEAGETIGVATNNVAEYRALLRGIELAAAGGYKVKHAGLKPLHEEAKRALREFDSWSIRHVPRAENADADRLVNQALDGAVDG